MWFVCSMLIFQGVYNTNPKWQLVGGFPRQADKQFCWESDIAISHINPSASRVSTSSGKLLRHEIEKILNKKRCMYGFWNWKVSFHLSAFIHVKIPKYPKVQCDFNRMEPPKTWGTVILLKETTEIHWSYKVVLRQPLRKWICQIQKPSRICFNYIASRKPT